MTARGRVLTAAIVVLVLVAAGTAGSMLRRSHRSVVAAPTVEIRAPEGARIRVQVLNGTKTRGLARRATILLRDRGFDVVETGTTTNASDTTLVLDLSGHPAWAATVAKLFQPARVATRADSSRYLDVAVVLGASWRPPTEPFNP